MVDAQEHTFDKLVHWDFLCTCFVFVFFPNVLMCTGKLWGFFLEFFAVLKKDHAGFAGENGLYPPAIRP